MKNFVQRGENLTLPAPYDLTSVDGALIGSIFGVAAGDALTGEDADLVTEGVFILPKPQLEAISIGDPLYWDDTAKEVTLDDDTGNNPKVGVAVAAAPNPSFTVDVRLNGSF